MKSLYTLQFYLIITIGFAQNTQTETHYCQQPHTNDYSYTHYRSDYNDYSANVFYSLEAAYKSPLKVRVLDLSNQGISSLSYRIGELHNLEVLVLRNNDLQHLPYQVFSLTHLKILDVSNNELTDIGYQVGELKDLKILILKNNRLTRLPYQISSLQSLQLLDASYNSIDEIPYQIANLKNLQKLYLNYNNIAYIPYQLSNLSKLKLLDIRNNPVDKIPYQIKQKNILIRI